jgi:hypothetical protein
MTYELQDINRNRETMNANQHRSFETSVFETYYYLR